MNPRHVAALALVASIVTAIALSGCGLSTINMRAHSPLRVTLVKRARAWNCNLTLRGTGTLARRSPFCLATAAVLWLGNR